VIDDVPEGSALVLMLATPPAKVIGEPIWVAPLKNVTLPCGDALLDVTVAVNVTEAPRTEGFADDTITVAVPVELMPSERTLEALAAKAAPPA
jgi:hypothetical protein